MGLQFLIFLGTWWAQEVLWGLLHPDQLGKESTEGVGVRIPFLEHLQYGREPVDVLRDTESPRVYKYHMSARYLAKHLRQGKVRYQLGDRFTVLTLGRIRGFSMVC